MAVTVSDVFVKVIRTLQDTGSTRWPLPELLGWLNLALSEISNLKPTAFTQTTTLSLAAGAQQTLPANVQLLIRPNHNANGIICTTVRRDALDGTIPNWHNPNVMPASPVARHLIQDETDPETFWVFPPNDGTGELVCQVAMEHTPIAEPGSPNDIEAYTSELGIADTYEPAVLDYILYRCYTKDQQLANSAGRAAAHKAQFDNALGVRQQVEVGASPNNPPPAKSDV